MSLVLDVPIDRLATTLAPLRGPRTDPASALASLPVRVAANEVVVRKARLLEANAPRRTLSAMDEARVVRSLADDVEADPEVLLVADEAELAPQQFCSCGRNAVWWPTRSGDSASHRALPVRPSVCGRLKAHIGRVATSRACAPTAGGLSGTRPASRGATGGR